jgi:preprotein translocase subunit YajC
MHLPSLVIAQAQEAPQGLSSQGLFIGMIGAVALMFYMQFRSQKGEHEKRITMLKSLKKGDPVVTTSGIIGTIVSVAEDYSEIVVRVDDNCRLRMKPDAIRDVVSKPESKT